MPVSVTSTRFAIGRHPAQTADLLQFGVIELLGGLIGVDRLCLRLNDADDPVLVDGIIDHHQIAFLEDVQWHLGARQQQRFLKRKHRDDGWNVSRAVIICVACLSHWISLLSPDLLRIVCSVSLVE
jgi:hypothetical protein